MNKELLKEEMKKRNLSMAELASLANVDRTTIWRILEGNQNCTVAVAAKITNGMKLKPKLATKIFFEG